MVGPEKDRLLLARMTKHFLLGRGVLRDGLGSFGNGVLGEFPGKEETNGGLDFAGGDGRPLIVVGEAARFGGDPLEEVVDERVHDRHGLGADAGVGVDLLENLVDVDGVRFLPLGLASLLVTLDDGLGGLLDLLGDFSRSFGRHFGEESWLGTSKKS